MFLIAYAFKGQVYVSAGRVIILSHWSCRTSAILNIFVPCLPCSTYTVFLLITFKRNLTERPVLTESTQILTLAFLLITFNRGSTECGTCVDISPCEYFFNGGR